MERGLTTLLVGRVLHLNCLQVDKRFLYTARSEKWRAWIVDLAQVDTRHRIQLIFTET